MNGPPRLTDADRAALAERFPEPFAGAEPLDPNGPLVAVGDHVALATALRDLGFVQYVSVVATHFPEPEERFEVATVLRRVARGDAAVFWWRVALAPGQSIPTLFPLFAGADWQEREQYDLVGVGFEGHPDLRRLMLPEDWEGHPLQKGYAIDTPHAPWR